MDWFIADTHFNDTETIRFIPSFYLNRVGCEASWYEDKIMRFLNKLMLDNMKRLIKPEDTLYHLGDVGKFETLADAKNLISSIPGKKILVMGNHDSDKNYVKLEVDTDDYVDYWKKAGFDTVCSMPVKYNEFTTMCHEPPYFSNFPQFTIFGHVHTNPMYRTFTSVSCCVSADRLMFMPISIVKIMAKRDYLAYRARAFCGCPETHTTDVNDALKHLENEYVF